jgi:serine/threonine protein kinase
MIDHVHALPEGYRLQEYTITGLLGFGEFGITYAARDNNLNKVVAIKEYLPSDLAVRGDGSTISAKSDQDKDSFDWGLERFLDEARTVALFDHPNIVRIHRFFEQNGTGYIVMEYIDGKTLSAELKEQGTLDEAELRRWLWPVIDGLKIVHKHGFLHRDIKPQNIMMRENGRPCLLDFGAARLAMGGRTCSLTSIMTPGFAPLEQYQTKGQGPWTDIYGLAAVMYTCIAGAKPQDALDRVTDDSLLSPETDSDETYSPHLLEGIVTALAVAPRDRPQSLENWLEILDAPAELATRAMPRKAKPPRPLSQPPGTLASDRDPSASLRMLRTAGYLSMAVVKGKRL